jgi:hypothetical protein
MAGFVFTWANDLFPWLALTSAHGFVDFCQSSDCSRSNASPRSSSRDDSEKHNILPINATRGQSFWATVLTRCFNGERMRFLKPCLTATQSNMQSDLIQVLIASDQWPSIRAFHARLHLPRDCR